MPLEDLTGTDKFINDLVITNPVGSTDAKASLDDHIRGLKNVLKNTFGYLTGALTVTHAEINQLDGVTSNVQTQLNAEITARQAAIDALHPVGSIKLTTSSINPGTYLPGTWVQIAAGRTLIGEGTGGGGTYAAGVEGGSKDAIVPAHTHNVTDPGHAHNYDASSSSTGSGGASGATSYTKATSAATTGISIDSAGESVTDKNMQPYLVVYIWERTA